jgi:hypothetical protein
MMKLGPRFRRATIVNMREDDSLNLPFAHELAIRIFLFLESLPAANNLPLIITFHKLFPITSTATNNHETLRHQH